MESNLKKEMLRSIDITRQNMENIMQISIESYAEMLSRLDLLAYLINSDNKK